MNLYYTGKNRTAIYAGEPQWGYTERLKGAAESPMVEEQVEQCCNFLEGNPDLTLTRIYRDYGQPDIDGGRAWKMLMDAVECRKVDNIVVSSICCVDWSFYRARHFIECFLFPAGVRFIDLDFGFDSSVDNAKEYFRKGLSRYLLWTRMIKEPKPKKPRKRTRPSTGRKRGRPRKSEQTGMQPI